MTNILIAIPVLNGEHDVKKSILSALNQSLKARILIIDNNSSDNTANIVKPFVDNYGVVYHRNSTTLGRTDNWNNVLDIFSKYEESHIKFLFSGDELLPNCIEECEAVISNYKDIAVIAFQYEFCKEGFPKLISKKNLSGYLSPAQVAKLNYIEGGFLGAIVCNVYGKIAIGNRRFNPYFVGKNDFDFGVLSGKDAYYIPKTLARANIGSRRTFQSALDYWIHCEHACNRAFWLEKDKRGLTCSEYQLAKERILLDFVCSCKDYYSLSTYIRLVFTALRMSLLKIYQSFKSSIHPFLKDLLS
jgi:glycosyltransferase involved in cell wall biosynthesis